MDVTDYLNSDLHAEDFVEEIVGASGPPTFEEAKLKEYFNSILQMKFRDGRQLTLYDSRHAMEHFFARHPGKTVGDYKDVIKKGMSKVYLGHKLRPDNYVIISKSTGIKIPIELRPDKYDPNTMVAVTPTTLTKDQETNLRNEVVIYVEGAKTWKEKVQKLTEASKGKCFIIDDFEDHKEGMPFQHIFDDGEYSTTFVEVEVD